MKTAGLNTKWGQWLTCTTQTLQYLYIYLTWFIEITLCYITLHYYVRHCLLKHWNNYSFLLLGCDSSQTSMAYFRRLTFGSTRDTGKEFKTHSTLCNEIQYLLREKILTSSWKQQNVSEHVTTWGYASKTTQLYRAFKLLLLCPLKDSPVVNTIPSKLNFYIVFKDFCFTITC